MNEQRVASTETRTETQRLWEEFVKGVQRVSQQGLRGQDGLALMLMSNSPVDHLTDGSRFSDFRFVGAGCEFRPAQERVLRQFASLDYTVTKVSPRDVSSLLALGEKTFTLGNTSEALGLALPGEAAATGVRITERHEETILPGIELVDVLARPVTSLVTTNTRFVARPRRYDPLHLCLTVPAKAKFGEALEDIRVGVLSVNEELRIAVRTILSLMANNTAIGELLAEQANMPGTKGLRRSVVGKISADEESLLLLSIRLICVDMNKVLDLCCQTMERTGRLLLSESMLRTLAYAACRCLTQSADGTLMHYPAGLKGLVIDLDLKR